jgi:hypothetical protein
MRHTAQRTQFFEILAKLLHYLVSGKSHVGYLHNHDDNPLHIYVFDHYGTGLIALDTDVIG